MKSSNPSLVFALLLALLAILPGGMVFSQCNTCVHINGPVNPLCDSTKLNWAAWTSVTPTTGSGGISSTLSVSVTKPTGGMSTTPGMFSGALFPPQYNVPINSTAIRNDLAGVFTFCFSTPVRDPQIALASVGAGGIPVQVNTSECYDVIWQGPGMSYPSNTSFIGTEGYTIIKFPGIHTCISFDYQQSETYCNLAFGTLDSNCQRVPTIACKGNPVTLNAIGGTSPYTWSPATGLNTTSGISVIATPSVTTEYFITDGNCTDSLVVTVNPVPAVSNISSSSFGCASPYGVATVSVFGGTPGYFYNWSPGGQTTQTATGLSSGSHSVTVTDAFNCSVSTNVSVTVTAPPAVTATSNQATCGNNNGTATANPSGGTPPYTYQWSNGGTTASISNLAPANYSVTLSDNSCNVSGIELVTNGDFSAGDVGFTSTYTVCVPNCAEGSYAVATNANSAHFAWSACGDHTTGTGNFMIVNGTTTAGVNVWCQTVSVSPNTNYTFSTWVVSQYPISPSQLQFSINGNPLCAVFSAPGSLCQWQQFFCTWNSGASTSANICILNQNTASSGNDFGLDDISFQGCTPCVVTTTVAVTQPALLTTTVTQTDIACNGNNTGGVVVNPLTGTPSYTYNWSSGQSTSAISGIPAGNYSVLVTDATGCTSTQSATITQPTLLTSSTTQATILCNGDSSSASATVSGGTPNYTYGWSNGQTTSAITGITAANYSVIITDANGCTSANSLSITEPALLSSSTTQSAILCNGGTANASVNVSGGTTGYTYTWSNGQSTSAIAGINAGNYSVTVADANGCSVTHTLSITEPTPLILSGSCNDSICTGDSTLLSVIASGGTPNYTYTWLPGPQGGSSISVIPTSSTIYSVSATDANGCVSAVQMCSVAVLPVPDALFDTLSSGMYASIYSFSDLSNGGTSWLWIFGDGTTSTEQNPIHTFPGAGTYTVTQVVYNQFGCPDTFKIMLDFEDGIIIPNVFTPDGDGINDVWYIPNSGLREFHVDIYDRWGLKVFETTADEIRWDGHSSAGKLLSDGTYYYVLKAVLASFNGDKDYSTKGHVTLLTAKRKQ